MKDFYFLPSHEWFNKKESTVGVSDYAQKELGDIVFIELPEIGDEVTKGQPFADVESVKAVSEIFSPVSGEVVDVNEKVLEDPSLINEDAFSAWLIKVDNAKGVEELIPFDEYEKTLD